MREQAFADSCLTIPKALQAGSWPLLQKDMTTPLRHAPAMPLTTLQRRWLKSLLTDKRIQLFDVDSGGLENVEPLFSEEQFVYFDRYSDGDNYDDPEYKQHFRLLLPGSDVEARPFLDYAKSIGVADHVEALGYRRDIRQLVGLSDVSVSSSRQEGLPINLVEAMALGNPVVATDVRGNRDLVQDGESGYLVPLNDSRAMADRILSLYTDPEQTAAFGVAGRTLAQDYAVEPVLHRMIEIYQALELL